MILAIAATVLILYALMVLIASRAIPHVQDGKQEGLNSDSLPYVSVIVPFRNERLQLPKLLESLSGLRYPGKFEILLIDDHSDDNPSDVISKHSFVGLQYLMPEEGVVGKKQNLERAVAKAHGEIILTTDADCQHQADWISSMVTPFNSDEIQMVLGPVRLRPENFFGRLQAIEFLSVMAITRLSAIWNRPLMANGANLGYRKQAFLHVGGYQGNDHLSSGDDEFLMQKVKKTFPAGIRFASAPSAVVETTPAAGLKDFFGQRIRWAGKWRHNTDGFVQLLAIGVFSIQIFTLVLEVDFLKSPSLIHLCLLIRFLADWHLLKKEALYQGSYFSSKDFLIVFLLYPIYVPITSLLSFFYRPDWKGRKVSI